MRPDGFGKLADTLQGRMEKVAEKPLVLDFGTIGTDWSLKTNTFDIPIPVEDYHVCRGLTWGKVGDTLGKTREGQGTHPHGPSGSHSQYSGDGTHSHPNTEGEHIHDTLIEEHTRSMKPGDRVLVAIIGTEAVVIDIVLPAKEAKNDYG